MRATIILVALMLTSCASTLDGATERGGTVTNARDMSDAFDVANDHCKQYGLVARVTGTDDVANTLRFDCIKP